MMRHFKIKLISALVAALALMTGGLIRSDAAMAGRERPPHGWHGEQVVRHWVYYPRYRHVYRLNSATDPYAYRYAPRGYYPYYNSGYWRHRTVQRVRFHRPPHYRAWGYPNRHWQHRAGHRKHHGRHRHHQW